MTEFSPCGMTLRSVLYNGDDNGEFRSQAAALKFLKDNYNELKAVDSLRQSLRAEHRKDDTGEEL